MKSNETTNTQSHLTLSEEEWDEIMEFTGAPAVGRSNEAWIHLLRQRLARQKREFLSLLDHAAENPELLEECAAFRHEIQTTRRRLADCRAMRHQLN